MGGEDTIENILRCIKVPHENITKSTYKHYDEVEEIVYLVNLENKQYMKDEISRNLSANMGWIDPHTFCIYSGVFVGKST